MLGFVGTVERNVQILGLFFRKFREPGSEFVQMEPGHFLIELLFKAVDPGLLGIQHQIDLRASGDHGGFSGRKA